MRTILFKAKRKDNCEWVEGYYLPGMKFPAYDGVNDFIIEKMEIITLSVQTRYANTQDLSTRMVSGFGKMILL